ncbi:MAG: hypothetical protein PHF39_05065 [Methanoregula sp.]|nr:hypothetical protein [Methanoregula sp.]
MYPDMATMNADLIARWNRTVRPEDKVYSLGDFAESSGEFQKYSSQLTGMKQFFLGNYELAWDFETPDDRKNPDPLFPVMGFLPVKNRNFLVTHDPCDVPSRWDGWVIHGHFHNHPKYPFVDGRRKRINVSCELTGYAPVNLDYIASLDLDRIEWMGATYMEPALW